MPHYAYWFGRRGNFFAARRRSPASLWVVPRQGDSLFRLGPLDGSILALDSLRWRLTGRIRWKGRTYR